MKSAGTVYFSPLDVAGRLDALGVKEITLRDSVKEGITFVFECTGHDPLYLPGMLGSGKIVRALRDRMIPLGWVFSNPRNYALTADPSGTLAIAVACGDSNTGREDATPTTRSEKGPATRDAIYGNVQLQLSQVDPRFLRVDTPASIQTWILLFSIDENAGETRLELSLPGGMDQKNYVTSWRERIILPPEPFGTSQETRKSDPTADPSSGAVEVAVHRRAAI